jgi:hypothetical protein
VGLDQQGYWIAGPLRKHIPIVTSNCKWMEEQKGVPSIRFENFHLGGSFMIG